jgi:rod shape-determining protein MreD
VIVGVGTRRVRLVLALVTLVVLQTSVFTHLRVFDAVPDLSLVATVAMAYEAGPVSGALFGFASGLATDLFLTTPLGLSALAFALTGYGVGLFRSGLIRESRGIIVLLGGAGGMVGNAIFIVVGGIAGRDELLMTHTIQVVVVAALYDALVASAVFPFMRWASRADLGRAWPPR